MCEFAGLTSGQSGYPDAESTLQGRILPPSPSGNGHPREGRCAGDTEAMPAPMVAGVSVASTGIV